MGLFRRRPPGRHQLGAAVRDIPSAVTPVVPHPPVSVLESFPLPPVGPAFPGPSAPSEAQDAGGSGPRVELGFRDGTTAALAPDSPQARALLALAGVLTRRD